MNLFTFEEIDAFCIKLSLFWRKEKAQNDKRAETRPALGYPQIFSWRQISGYNQIGSAGQFLQKPAEQPHGL